MEYNGGAVVAMKGKQCVAIASDKRFGVQSVTVSTQFPKIFPLLDHTAIGLAGLATDVQTLSNRLRFKVNLYQISEDRPLGPKTLANMISSTLYEKRFGPYFAEPVVAGLDPRANYEPFICSMDLIGCINFAKDFVVAGTSSPNLYGLCESLYEPDLEPEDLFETLSQALMNAVDRDALSGWGAVVYLITPDRLIIRELQARMD